MTTALVASGDRVIVITKRLFTEDVRRHFIGSVIECSGGLMKVQGYAWIANAIGQFERRAELRTRIFSLAYGGEVVFVLPIDVDIERMRYTTQNSRLIITNDAEFSLDISEFGVGR